MSIEMTERRGPRISIFPTGSSTPSASASRSSWLPFRMSEYARLPNPGSNSPTESPYPTRQISKKRFCQLVGLTIFALATLGVMRSLIGGPGSLLRHGGVDSLEEGDGRPDNWGWHEAMGWREDRDKVADLGELAEQRYRLGFENTQAGKELYYSRLYSFASSLSTSLYRKLAFSINSHLPPSLGRMRTLMDTMDPGPPSMISYKTIHQTDKTDNNREETRKWVAMNKVDGWKLNFLDDEAAFAWVDSVFGASDVEWAWRYMHRGVLRADFLRYLLPLVEGGVYSDVDTVPIRPIEQWGHQDVEYLDLSNTDGPTWEADITTYPAVIVAIDVNVHKRMNWGSGWPRPLGICQWTLSSAPHHPIFIDAARRVVNATRVVESWEEWRSAEINRLQIERPEGYEETIGNLQRQGRDHAMNVMEWTGPGLFSDSVLSYILARYDVTWHRLRALDHPLRIGEVLILPITAFSPGGEPDFHAEGPDSPQADVLHEFRGSWKGEGA